MHPRVVLTIAWKDLLAAARDGRILLAILLPLALGVFYNVVMPESQRPTFKLAVFAAEPTHVVDALRTVIGPTANLMVTTAADPGAVTRDVADKKVDIGLVVPAGFDRDLATSSTPALEVVQPQSPGAGAGYVTAALSAALREMAGQHPPATVTVTPVATATGPAAMGSLSPRTYTILGTLVMLIAMIAIYVLPVLLTEEYEKKTADTLLLIGSHVDIVIGKALVGLAYVALSVVLFLVATRIPVANPPLFAAGIVALAVTLIAFGLLLGGLARTVAQLNTWSAIPLLILIMPVYFAALGFPAWIQTVLDATPGMQATRLLVDGASATPVHGSWPVSVAVLAGWAIAGYALVVGALRRREG